MVNLAPPKIAAPPVKRPTRSGVQVILLLVVIVLFAWFIVLPASRTLGDRQEQVRQAKNELKDIEDNTANLRNLIDQLNNPDNQKDVQSLDQALPIDDRISKAHILFDQIVKASGMTLASVSIDQSTATSVVAGQKDDVNHPFQQERKQHVTQATLGVTGSIEQGVGLMQLLENDARVIDVDAIDVTSDGSGKLSFRLKLKLYYYAPAGGAAAPGAQ